MRYKRAVKPSKVLPPSYISGYYGKDPQTLLVIEKWLKKNGLTILFTLGEAYGDETVWLDNDGHIYIGTDKLPRKDWLKRCLLKISPDLLRESVRDKWTPKKMFERLKNRSYNP